MSDMSSTPTLLPASANPAGSTAFPATLGSLPQAQYSEVGDAAGGTGTSYTISIGDLFDGRLSSSSDVDWVKLNLVAGQSYVFSVWGTGGSSLGIDDTVLGLYNSGGGLLTFNDNAQSTTGNYFSQIEFTASSTGTYFLGIAGVGGDYGNYTLQTATNIYTLDQVVTQLTEFGWGINTPISHNERTGDTMVADISLLTAAGKQLALWALDAWSTATGITFVTGTSGADIVFDDSQAGAFGGPNSYYPSTGQIVQSDVNISTGWLTSYGTNIGSYSFLTYLHEIGHALGLYHAGPYDGSASFATDAAYLNDSYQMTIMSYFDMVDNTYINASDYLPITPMIADIAAVEALYGPNTTAHLGNTIWGAHSNVGGYLQTIFGYLFDGIAVNSAIFNNGLVALTIQDSGGVDTIDLSTVTQGNRVDLGQEAVSDVKGLIGNVVIARGTVIENVFGGSGNDTLTGNSADNQMRGNGGADDLTGDAGNDTLDGGDGNDTIAGGAGSDSLIGGLGTDLLSYRDATTAVQVDLLSGAASGTYAAGDVFTGFENLEGGTANDTLLGDDTDNLVLGGSGDDEIEGRLGNDTLSGGGGNDTLNGGAGADAFDGGTGLDTVSYAGSVGSLRVDLMFSTINTNIAAGDTYVSIENLIGSQGSDNLRGTTGANHIQGMANVDYVFGRAGNDTIEGGVGDDVLFGGVGADTLDGGANRDRAQYSESLTALVIDLLNPANNTGEAAGDVYISIEDLAGSRYADSISGDLGDNRLFGREGADLLFGRAGNDYLNGGAHNDTLDGGAGNDTLRGGQNSDTFVFNDGADLVEDFTFAHADQIAIDKALLGGVVLTGTEIVSTYASIVGGHVVFDFGSGDVLTIQSLSSLTGLDSNVFSF
jgi:serralysin